MSHIFRLLAYIIFVSQLSAIPTKLPNIDSAAASQTNTTSTTYAITVSATASDVSTKLPNIESAAGSPTSATSTANSVTISATPSATASAITIAITSANNFPTEEQLAPFTLDYVLDGLRVSHLDQFDIDWSDQLQEIAGAFRDREHLQSGRPSVLGELKLLGYNSLSLWSIKFKLQPFAVRTAVPKFIGRKRKLIKRLKSYYDTKLNVGCAVYHKGTCGKIYCVYGFSP